MNEKPQTTALIPEITIFLTTPEAIVFKEFQQFHSTFELLCKSGVFDTTNGQVILHFDSSGEIKKIERHSSLFDSRVKPML